MAPTNIIASITSVLRHSTGSSGSAQAERRGLLSHDNDDPGTQAGKRSYDDQDVTVPADFREESGLRTNESATPTQARYSSPSANYGSINQGHSGSEHDHDHSEHLDGNDIDIWRDVETRGLDGRGSIKSVDEEEMAEVRRIEEEERRQEEEEYRLTSSSYRFLAFTYLFVPIFTFLACYLLVLLAQYAWPPSIDESHLPPPLGPLYPHPFLPQPFIIGILASVSVQAVRGPVMEGVEIVGRKLIALGRGERAGVVGERQRGGKWSGLFVVLFAVALHTTLHNLLRLLTLYLITPTTSTNSTLPILTTTTQLFQSSYHLALGWGLAEASWGIVKGWFGGMRLWRDVLSPESTGSVRLGEEQRGREVQVEEGVLVEDFAEERDGHGDGDGESSESSMKEEEDLEVKIEALERMKGRRDLERALGIPFPNITLAIHFLWRLDTLLLHLGLTLLISSFYYNTPPIYRRPLSHPHDPSTPVERDALRPGEIDLRQRRGSRFLPLVVVGVVGVHVVVSWVWAVGVRKLGLSAVTWASLIISLGSVFAGLGSWGGLV